MTSERLLILCLITLSPTGKMSNDDLQDAMNDAILKHGSVEAAVRDLHPKATAKMDMRAN